MHSVEKILIIGAGPAGLACAHELLKKNPTKKVTLIEKDKQVGGLCKTIEYKGFKFDIGGHRFFTKIDEVEKLWRETLSDDLMERKRLSRIYYKDKFYNYPIKPFNVLFNLGTMESFLLLLSYLKQKIFPYKQENTFEEWISNRFGRRLYQHFFKSYTEKVWGIPCDKIQAKWAAQRIRGLSLTSAVKNAFENNKKNKKTIKTLIDKFKYPKKGPGQMYEKMAENIEKLDGEILKETEVTKFITQNNKIKRVEIKDKKENQKIIDMDYAISSMPITELVKKIDNVNQKVLDAANNLSYRSLLIVNLILNEEKNFPDNWIYVHNPEVKLGRIQNFKQWSPYMSSDITKTSLGLEYFCTEGDKLWNMENEKLINLGLNELEKIGLAKKHTFIEGFIMRTPNTHPIYDETYKKNLEIIKDFISNYKNLQPIGRCGMFKYNNMDHSILAGLYAARNILASSKIDIWKINIDEEYYEER